MRQLLVFLCVVLTGCTSAHWVKQEDIVQTKIYAVQTPIAEEFCSALLGVERKACAVRLIGQSRCVIVVPPNDTEAIAHESVHCFGFDHPER